MKKLTLIFIMAIGVGSAFAQQTSNGIGLRLGEPMGITYKRYLPNNRAWEFGLGSAPSNWGNKYYENAFDHYSRYDNYDYRWHSVQSIVYLQGRYLLHNNIPVVDLEGKLDWYWGIGALLRSAKIKYHYWNKQPPYTDYQDTHTDINFGPEGIAGMEYTFERIPLTLFGEISLFFELVDQPLHLKALAGTGARYNF